MIEIKDRVWVFHLIEDEARRHNVGVIGTQVCGTLHNQVLIDCAAHQLRLVDFQPKQIIENSLFEL